MRRIAAILCSAAILVSYPGIAALGQEPEIAIPVGAEVSGSSLYGQDEGWTGGDVQAAEAPADQNQTAVQIAAPSAILMEASTGQVIYEKGADEKRSPASVTKVMTLILIFDALQSGKIQLTDEVVTSAHAKSMGGSQVFLEEGEKQTVETLIKCIVIASGNDASVAMAEYIAGSEEEFVRMMNERAAGLGMANTHFVDCCGLTESADHYTTARDIAVMSRELINKYPQIHNYSTIWMENITHVTKQGTKEFGLSNTNKLLKMATNFTVTGLKTGSTSIAKYCLSATAEKDGVRLIAAIMAAPDFKTRFADAQTTLISATDTTLEIYEAARSLFDRLWNYSPIRRMGVYTSKVSPKGHYQYQLFDRGLHDKYSRLDAAVDEIRKRYGEDCVQRAVFVGNRIPHMSGGIDKVKRTGVTKAV